MSFETGGESSKIRQKRQPTLEIEQLLWQQGYMRVAAVDEVGRGALAGSVVAAAVILPPFMEIDALSNVQDSKQLSRGQRQHCLAQIRQVALAIGLGSASALEIDRINIRRATALAMQRALQRVIPFDHVLVDGLPVPELGPAQTAVVKGDQHCLAIAAASVVAKVTRDRWMQRLASFFPEYGWSSNVGYGTPQHRRAICAQGPTRLHRRRFLHPEAWQLLLDLDTLDQLPS